MFKWLKRFCVILLVVLVSVFAVVFSLENSQVITPVFFGFPFVPLGVGLWMATSLFFGALIGLLVSLFPVCAARYAYYRKDKEIQRLERKVSDLLRTP